jgi:8-oxo-dGTP pyrophosphatase MutT (NUDIX family)
MSLWSAFLAWRDSQQQRGHEKLNKMSIRQVSSRIVYHNHWMTVREDVVERDNGHHGIYGVVEKHDSAVILPIDGDHIYLVEQFRYPIGRRSLELPQGSLEAAGLDPETIAREELLQETGIIAAKLELLGAFNIAVGYSRQRDYAFLATGLTFTECRPDREEHDLLLHRISLEQFQEKIRNNTIDDAQTLAAWAFYRARK